MKLIVYNGYPLSVVVAVTMHTLLLAMLLYLQSESPPEIMDIIQPSIVKAILQDENPQLRNERLLEQQRLVRLDQQRQSREEQQRREQQEQQRAEQAAAEEAQRQQQDLEVRQQRELEARQQTEREAAALAERQEQQRREAELQRQQQEQRQREQEQQRQRELAAEQERQRQADSDAAAAAEIARTEFEMVQAYTGVIHDLVQQNWSRPPSARNGMTAVVRIQMVPTGDILNVEIVQSSGDAAFDRAAETAIFRVGRFTELQGMPINMFNSNFRSLLLTFRPEDLLN